MDLVAVPRIARLLSEHPAALDKLFTPSERAYCAGKRRRLEHLAARFAAKEAVLKAVGTGLWRRMRWTDVEIVNTPLGRPRVQLHGAVAERARRGGLREIEISLSHTADLAIAQAVAVLGPPAPQPPAVGTPFERGGTGALPPDRPDR